MMHVVKRAPFALILAASMAISYAGTGASALAQDDEDSSGPPPAVARLSVADGQVGIKHGDGGQEQAGAVNAPLEAGDYLTTGDSSRAEIQLDPNTIVRAGSDTQLRFTQLDGQQAVTQIAQGSIELRVFATGSDNVSVQTPSVDVEPSEAGEYLITVTGDGNTQVTARSGSLAVVTPQGTQQVDPGRTMVVAGSATNPQYQYIDEVAQTDLEQWGDQRDEGIVAANGAEAPYVNGDMVGTSDLDQYGQWVDIPGYGDAWVPSGVAPDWTPYSDGSWVSLNYYGPTWVAVEPWGWAPYHYGRWFYAPSYGWAWYPGPRYIRPVWSPALVAFFGFGGGTSIGIGFGNVGWVPLAPGELYRPWWGPGASFSLAVSFTNYRNYAHGFVGVPYATWQRGIIRGVHPMAVSALNGMHFYSGAMNFHEFNNTRYTSRTLASDFPRTQYQRFAAIHPIGAARSSFAGAARPVGTGSAWQRFDDRTSSYNRTENDARNENYTRSASAQSSAWQHFDARPSYATQQRASTQYNAQRQYSQYNTQREYNTQRQYNTQQYRPQVMYGQNAPRQYNQYQTQRSYNQYQPQRQYGQYQTQRQYSAPRQYSAARQYSAPRQPAYHPQQSTRSAPSHSSSNGNHPHGPGRS